MDTAALVDHLTRWSHRPVPTAFPYAAVLAALRRHGKHHAPPAVLEALGLARTAAARGGSPRLAAFLATALDKPGGAFDNPSYLALAVLPLPGGDDPAAAARQRDRLLVLLVADLLRFELAALRPGGAWLPELPPDRRRVEKRLRHGVRVVRPALERLGLLTVPLPPCPYGAAETVVAAVSATASVPERAALERSMVPVSLVHDEHLFIRVLQAYETVFTAAAVALRAAVGAIAAPGRSGDGAALLHAAAGSLDEARALWSLLGTMQPAAFLRFREFTDGASAIQSRSYKEMESLCRRPDARRLDSPAYHAVPEVRARVLAGRDTVSDALARATARGRLAPAEAAEVRAAMDAYAAVVRRWRTTHLRLAERMLGDRRGTGDTEGQDYLREAAAAPVFAAGCPVSGGGHGRRRRSTATALRATRRASFA